MSSLFLLATIALFSLVQGHDHLHANCTHDHLDHPEPELNHFVAEDFPPTPETSRRLSAYPQMRMRADYSLLSSAPNYRDYVQNKLVPAVLSYFEGALRVKYPVKGELKMDKNVKTICGVKVPTPLKNGVDADYYFMIDSKYDEGGSWVAESYSCQLASGSKRPLIGKTILNRALFKDPKGDVLLHEKNIYLLMHELTHILGFSASLYPHFIDSKGNTLKGHVKSRKLNGKTATVLDVPSLTKKVRSHFGCSSIAGAYMENSGGDATAGSHFERRQYGHEVMTSGLVYQQSYSELTLAMFEATGWYDVDYDYADPYWFGEGQGCNFLTKSCSSKGMNFEEFCKGSGKGCTAGGRGAGFCGSDIRSDGCRFVKPRVAFDCENPDGNRDARLPELQAYGRFENSKCFMGDLTTSKSASDTNFCFKYDCIGSGTNTKLEVKVGKNTVTCKREGRLEVPGYNGAIECPDPLTFCKTVGRKVCPRGCMGRGKCVNGECKCSKGRGKDCAGL